MEGSAMMKDVMNVLYYGCEDCLKMYERGKKEAGFRACTYSPLATEII
jgi:hypothetical protein